MLKRLAGGAVILVMVIGGMVAALLSGTQGVVDGADVFMKALDEQRLDDAYALLTTELKEEVDRETFDSIFEGIDFENWDFPSREVANNNGVNTGSVSGQTVVDGETFDVELGLIDRDGWKINAYSFQPVASTPDNAETTESDS